MNDPTRKIPRATRGSRASTSSVQAASSSPPKDLLGLGKHLVHELGLGDSTDTLGRWLAHEIAEAVHRAEHADTEARRARARREVANLATSLWERRDRLPGRAYPLAPFRRLLETLTVLRADERRRWWGASPEDREVASLFQDFGRLMPLLFLTRIASDVPRPRLGDAAYEALTSDEQALLSDVAAWMDACAPEVGENAPPVVRVVFVDESGTPLLDASQPHDDVATPTPAADGGAAAVADAAPRSSGDNPAPEAHLTQEAAPECSPAVVRQAAAQCIDDLIVRLTRLRASLTNTRPSESSE